MTRVTLVSYDDEPPQGGQGVVLRDMRKALRQRGVEVFTVSGRGDHAVPFPRRIGRAPLDFSLHLRRHPELLTQESPDVLHAFGGPGGVLLTHRADVPLLYTANHTYRQAYTRTHLRRAMGVLEARAYRNAAKVLPISTSTAAAVRAMGIPADRIEVIPCGVDLPPADDSRHEPGRLLFVGRLEREKGVFDALTVMASLARDRSDVHGCVIGTGRLEGVLRTHAGSAGNIEYLGAVDDATLHAEYARAALLLMPSRYEGLGMVALEAQAAGTPVVGYNVDGLRDAVQGGGMLVPHGDVSALRAACVALLDNPSRMAELGSSGREWVRRHHSWETAAARLEEIYTSVKAG